MIEHRLYGLQVFSEVPLFDWSVPESALAPGEHSSLTVRPLGKLSFEEGTPLETPLFQSHARDLYLHTDRELALSAPGQPWRLQVRSVVTISWHGGDSTVYYQLHENGSKELFVFWFVHIFLPVYLTLERGYDFIHSAAVAVDGEPILFIAPSMGGKSTLGDYFLRRGHPMLSDDKVATFLHEGAFWAVPSHPHHRPYREFEVLGKPVEHFQPDPRPIHAFYVLEQGKPEDDVEIAEVTGFRKFEELLPNYLFAFEFLRVQRMRWLAQLADQSMVFKVHRPWNLDRQQEVYEAICAHSRSLGKNNIDGALSAPCA